MRKSPVPSEQIVSQLPSRSLAKTIHFPSAEITGYIQMSSAESFITLFVLSTLTELPSRSLENASLELSPLTNGCAS